MTTYWRRLQRNLLLDLELISLDAITRTMQKEK